VKTGWSQETNVAGSSRKAMALKIIVSPIVLMMVMRMMCHKLTVKSHRLRNIVAVQPKADISGG
jgi:hypothetical protein